MIYIYDGYLPKLARQADDCSSQDWFFQGIGIKRNEMKRMHFQKEYHVRLVIQKNIIKRGIFGWELG